MTRISNTPRGDHFVGDPSDEYLVRLWGEDTEWGVLWVDVAIYQVHYVTRTPGGWEMHGRDIPAEAKREYDMPSRPDRGAAMTANPGEAVAVCEGFVRDASCTQLRFPHGLHVDGVQEMAGLCNALTEAQRLALELMARSREDETADDLDFPVT